MAMFKEGIVTEMGIIRELSLFFPFCLHNQVAGPPDLPKIEYINTK